MAEAPLSYVCDLTLVMRARLLCGLYSRRTVSPRWRPLAQAYCITVAGVTLLLVYNSFGDWNAGHYLLILPQYILYWVSSFISLWTGDEYVYKFYSQNKLTDITLDSPKIFNNLQKRIQQAYITVLLVYFVHIVLYTVLFYKYIYLLLAIVIPALIFEVIMSHAYINKLLVMALFEARLLVLKRRLLRYGFRSVGRARPQPYCDIYHEVMQGLDATDNPLKLWLFLDWIVNCCRITGTTAYFVNLVNWKGLDDVVFYINMVDGTTALLLLLAISFGHVALLESAAAHCEDMAVFTVTQLIKTPTAEERQRMYELLDALEHRGARYHVLRVLPLNARLVLAALSFCSAQILVIINFTNK